LRRLRPSGRPDPPSVLRGRWVVVVCRSRSPAPSKLVASAHARQANATIWCAGARAAAQARVIQGFGTGGGWASVVKAPGRPLRRCLTLVGSSPGDAFRSEHRGAAAGTSKDCGGRCHGLHRGAIALPRRSPRPTLSNATPVDRSPGGKARRERSSRGPCASSRTEGEDTRNRSQFSQFIVFGALVLIVALAAHQCFSQVGCSEPRYGPGVRIH